MKAGAEAHFLAGQIFMFGVAAIAIAPRMPYDVPWQLGGSLSRPFRQMLCILVLLAAVRIAACHLNHPDSAVLLVLDGILGTLHVVGQSFLCLTTAYLLRYQLSQVIHLDGGPGGTLMPYLVAILAVSMLGIILSHAVHPNWIALVSLAEALSCYPVLTTVRLYATTTTYGGQHQGRGSVLTQIVAITEYWYLVTSLAAAAAELVHSEDVLDGDDSSSAWSIALEALRHHEENGVDDWMRLLMHSIFLNAVDEMTHLHPATPSTASTTSTNSNVSSEPDIEQISEHQALMPTIGFRKRLDKGDHTLPQFPKDEYRYEEARL